MLSSPQLNNDCYELNKVLVINKQQEELNKFSNPGTLKEKEQNDCKLQYELYASD